MSSEDSISPLNRAIACAVLQPALRSLLIFDAPFAGLQQIAHQIVESAAQAGQKLRPVIVGATEHDDDLWGESILPNVHGRIEAHAQLFLPPRASGEIPLLIIPDLSALGLAVARASIVLMGAPVAHLERHGQQGVWSPRYYWLASCPQELVGAVSPHLLDRFALRLSWQSAEKYIVSHRERVGVLERTIQQDHVAPLPQLDATLAQNIKQVTQHPPLVEITPEACEEILLYQEGETFHQRRELALARCALALAQLTGDAQLLASHVAQAAKLMGLQKLDRGEDTNESPGEADSQLLPPSREENRTATATPPVQKNPTVQAEGEKNHIEVQTQEPSIQRTIEYVTAASNPYPEDTEPILREAASLQMPLRRFISTRSDRGPIIGVEPSTTFRDLALVSTLMRALLFQAFRQNHNNSTGIVLDWTDLRKYRRAAEPERLLLLLLDYTCSPLTQRQRALVPYLGQAYRDRASITIIKVGAATSTAKSNLRAERVSARSILVPAISAAIDAPTGNATPLAHGLELALQVIQHTLQHGRSAVQHITFVVISDGRGNVPLAASHSNTIVQPVAQAGIDDALELACEIGKIKHVNGIVLSPRLRYYRDLPLRLADALNVPLITLEDGEDGQV